MLAPPSSPPRQLNRIAASAFVLTLALAAALPCYQRTAAATGAEAAGLLKTAGVRGGLLVHLGCGSGKLTVKLAGLDSIHVHGLDTDPAAVAQARKRLLESGLHAKASVDTFDGKRLPYIDNLVRLLVAEDLADVPRKEVMRVLAPRGVALIGRGEDREKLVKPWPQDIDEWTHYLHDATNNAVAQDDVVGPPRHMQWIGSPDYLRHHDHMSGLSAMVSARGRLFYIMDLGPRWSVQMLPRWTLVARDAFSGVVLWQRPIEKWHAHLWPLKKGPADLMRRLVAVGDEVYVTLGVGEPVSVLDAATGRTMRTLKGTEGAEEMILSDGVLYVLVNPELDAYKTLSRESVSATRRAGATWNWDERPREVVAIETASPKLLWSAEARVAPVTLAAAAGRLYYHDGDRIVCRDGRTGKEVWTSKPLPRWDPLHVLYGPALVVHEDVVLFAGGEKMDPYRGGRDTMTAVSAETGETLWTAPHPPSGYASAEDLLVIDGLVWCGETTNCRDSGVFTGRDLHTGEVVREFPPDDWQPHMSHHRCYRAKATSNYILASRTGIEFVDFRARHWIAHHWVRGSCNYGILPCNGLVYAPPHSCACYLLAKLNGLNALAPARKTQRKVAGSAATRQEPRLLRGPAYEEAQETDASSASQEQDPGEWPTYRGDPARSGSTDAPVPLDLKQTWTAKIGGKLSSLVVAGGRVLVASVERHTVHALDVETGEELWRFAAAGRVDSPPTVWHDLVLFGSADGRVYCLRAADGALVWRFRAAPDDLRLLAQEQVESVWPVHGSVLVREGVAYCVAGRSMWLDGGMRLVRLDSRSGRKLSETVLDDKYPGTEDNLQEGLRWPNLPVALPDVLSCDGRYVYMRSQHFTLDGKRPEVVTPRDYSQQQGETAHLFSPTGFLDDSWWHRTYWMYGRSFISAAGGWYLATYQAPSGRILVVDGDKAYGFGRAPMRVIGTPNTYHLFACAKHPELINPNPKAPPRKRGSSIYGRVTPTRLKYAWSEGVPLLGRALVATENALLVAGPPATADEQEVYARFGDPEIQARMADHVAAFEGRKGGLLLAVSKEDGSRLGAWKLDGAPVFDGLIAAGGRLFVATLDGRVLCLGSGSGKPLPAAPEVKPGPVPSSTGGIFFTRSHPDFQKLANVEVGKSNLGYRIQSPPRITGLAVKKLDTPLTGRAVLKVKIRPRPGAPKGTPGNGFLAFGAGPEDKELVKCGFRISGQHLYVVQGTLTGGSSTAAPVTVHANEVVELTAAVDLDDQKVSVSMSDKTLETSLKRRLDAIGWIGYCVGGVDADFSPIEISGPKP